MMLAGRYTLLDDSAARELLPLCVARGVKLILAGVFNSGILASGATPGAHFHYQPAPEAVRSRVARLASTCASLRGAAAGRRAAVRAGLSRRGRGGGGRAQRRGDRAKRRACAAPDSGGALAKRCAREGLKQDEHRCRDRRAPAFLALARGDYGWLDARRCTRSTATSAPRTWRRCSTAPASTAPCSSRRRPPWPRPGACWPWPRSPPAACARRGRLGRSRRARCAGPHSPARARTLAQGPAADAAGHPGPGLDPGRAARSRPSRP